ncbi:MAG: M23 family metallopeptidase [Clostridia bacterium]|nr:M23 family metallopeptidase [Clostridia bacterium]
MKKIISITALAVIGCVAIYFLFFKAIVPHKGMTQLTIENTTAIPTILSISNDSEIMNQYIDTVNQGKTIEQPSSFDPEYTVLINYDNREAIHLKLDFDTETPSITIEDSDQQRYYRVDDYAAIEPLFLDDRFKDIYLGSQLPEATLAFGESIISQSSETSNWAYRRINDSWYESENQKTNIEDCAFQIENPSLPLTLTYDLAPQSTVLQVFSDDAIIYETSVEGGSFLPYLDEGDFTYMLTSTWDSSEYRGTQQTAYDIRVDLPVRFRLSKSAATAGDFITVFADYVNSDETLFINQNMVSWTPTFFDDHGTKLAFIPLNYWAKTGDYKISLSSSKTGESGATTDFDVKIKYKDFTKQYLYIDETVEASTRNDDSYAQYNKYFNPARATISPEKLWEGPFIAPVTGRISTQFGEMRYVNDALTSYRHSGIDFAVPRGTPVMAPNRGRVNLAMFLTLTGNTIVIDHGMGLFSVYFHLDSLNVEKGQMVSQSDIIGTVGSTGFSTGPHLHYTTSIGTVNFDPNLLVDADPSQP